jgi:hypothetical protein
MRFRYDAPVPASGRRLADKSMRRPKCRAMRHAAALLCTHSLFGASMLALFAGM